MLYDYVFIGKKFTKQQRKQIYDTYGDNSLIFCHQNTLRFTREDRKNSEFLQQMEGILLELRSLKDGLEVEIMDASYRLCEIHARRVVFTEISMLKDNEMVSLYEGLWAAGVRLKEQTLLPSIGQTKETSITNLYYIPC